MSRQHCENQGESYDVKWETVHCYPRNVDCCCTWSERAVEGGLMLSQESQSVFQNLLLFWFAYNKALNDLSIGKQWILLPSNPNVSLDFVSGKVEILGKKIHCSPRDHSLSVKYHFPFYRVNPTVEYRGPYRTSNFFFFRLKFSSKMLLTNYDLLNFFKEITDFYCKNPSC